MLLCTGFGVYSFLRLNSVENRQDFNLYTLVPQDATAILETDRMADLVEDINELNCSKDNHFQVHRRQSVHGVAAAFRYRHEALHDGSYG